MKKILLLSIFFLTGCSIINSDSYDKAFLGSNKQQIQVFNAEFKKAKELARGLEVDFIEKEIKNDKDIFYKIKFEKKEYLVKKDNIVKDVKKIVFEKELFTRTNATITLDSKIMGLLKKGDKANIIGFDKINSDGSVNKYEVEINGVKGFVYSKYLVENLELALVRYDHNGNLAIHDKRLNTLLGGSAVNLDFYPREKAKFKDNIMPDEVRALYINAAAVNNIDKYIDVAKRSNINALVIDIKDNTMPAYKSLVMEKYSPTNFTKGFLSFDKYKELIKKAKDADLYVIGRITLFKDSYIVQDHPEVAIVDNRTGLPLLHNGSNWPSGYNRYVWEFNLMLAKEAVTNMGFNEIQFDYVRFPDRTITLERENAIDFKNTYLEDKAVAIQNFLMYATDELHEIGAYVSADVFGESAHQYVTAYGQYFGAISNVVDVISPMPYPDHFATYEYDFKEVVWTVPYKVLSHWGSFVEKRQLEIPTPAKVRNWLQAYDSIRKPYIIYDSFMVEEQIKAFYERGMTGGYMTWNSASSLARYEQYSELFKKDLRGMYDKNSN